MVHRDEAQNILLNNVPYLILLDQNKMFTSPIIEEKVYSTFFQMKSYGTPDPNGFPTRFYQYFCPLLKDDILGIVRESFDSK